MASNHDTGHRRTDESARSLLDGLPSLSRYDVPLVAIPAVFLVALAGHALFQISLHAAVASGALVGTALLADALFFNPPTARRSGGTPR